MTDKIPATYEWYAKAVGKTLTDQHEFTPERPITRMPVPKAWADINTPLTALVTEENPLVVDHFTSFRSPYCYLAMGRMAELQNTYNVRINIRVVFPIAVKNQQFFQDAPDYRYLHDFLDAIRLGQFHEIPYRFPVPDFVTQEPNTLVVSAIKPETWTLVRCAAAAQEQGRAFQYVQRMMRYCWDGQTDNWMDYIGEALTAAGMDGPAVIDEVMANPDKYQAIIEQNETDLHASGYGGVPNNVFRGEPFWGQDRIDMLLWRLKWNGLTRKWPLVD